MNRRSLVCAILLAFIFTPVSGLNSPNGKEELYRDGEVLIKLSRSCTPADVAEIASTLGATVKYRFKLFDTEYWHISAVSVAEAIGIFDGDPRVEFIEPNYRIRLDATYPDDPMFLELWGMFNRGEVRGKADADIDATDAWDIETGGDVIVGVCDGGVDYNHEDLAANIYVNPREIPGNNIDDDNNGFVDDVHGWDFGDDDNDPMDEAGHGSHVAGTIAAVGNNGVGVVGVNWHAKILPLKIVDKEGGGFTYPAARAIEYAIMMGARVTNHSWGGGNPSTALNEAIEAAEAAGLLTVASAGNSGVELNDYNQHFPAGLPYDGIVSVANTTRDDRLAGSSNWSAENVDLGAPGSGILSTIPGNQYASYTGTSMSAPHVTGAIALIWARAPYLTAMQVKELLLSTVDPLPDLQGKTVSGGRLNIHGALAALDDQAPAAVTDLSASLSDRTTVSLMWTATGDNGTTGTASRYDVRISDQPFDESNFDLATPVFDPPPVGPAGSVETFSVPDLRNGTAYYFALRVFDASGNGSPASNIATVTTLIADPPPQIQVSPSSLVKTLMTGAQATKSFSITNTGAGDLSWTMDVIDQGYVPGVVTAEGDSPVFARPFELGEASTPPLGITEGFLHGVRIVFDTSMDRIQDRWDTIVEDLRARGATIAFNENALDPSALDTTDVLWLTDPPPPATITKNDVLVIADWVRGGGGLLLDGDDDVTADIFNRVLAGMGAGIEYSSDDGTPGVSSSVYPHTITDGVSSIFFDQNGSHLTRVTEPAMALIDDPGGTPAVAVAATGSGRVVAMADELADDSHIGTADNRHFANAVFGWLAGSFWAAADPVSGVVPAGETTDVDVLLDARGLAGGIYEAELRIESNDPVSSSAPVNATLGVTAAPDIALSHSAIDYGLVFTTVTATETLGVFNAGKETLTVHSVDVTGEGFSVDVTNFSLAPDEGRGIAVSLSPGAPGTVTGTLSIASNDPDDALTTIHLSAVASDPPIISVAPESLSETRYGDETITRTLTITNDGEYDLEFLVVVEDIEDLPYASFVPSSSSVPIPVQGGTDGELLTGSGSETGSALVTPIQSAEFDNTAGLVIFADDFEDGDFLGWDELGAGRKEVTDQTAAAGTIFSYHEYNSPPGHFDGVIKEWGAAQPGYISFHIRPGAVNEADAYVLFVGSNRRYITYVYCSSGGQLCVNAGNPGEDCSIEYEAERWYFIELKNVDFESQTFDYYVDHVPIKEDIPFMAPTEDIAAMMLYNYQGGGQAWWDEIVVSTEHIVTWLTIDPSIGVVLPHSSIDVDVTFDATQLFTGRHEQSIVISSNDPTNPEVVIPATIDVTAVPNIAVSDTLLDYGKTVIGNSKTLPLTIINRSIQENLEVTDIVADHPAFAVDTTTVTVAPNGRQTIEVDFVPIDHGPAVGTLTIYSNDRDEPAVDITLSGMGVDAPVLSVVPDNLEVELAAGQSVVESIFVENAVANPEAADLEFVFGIDDASPLDWLFMAPNTGTVKPGSTLAVVTTFDASDLIEGDYPANITGVTNIPGDVWHIVVTTMLHVNGAARIAITDSLQFGTTYVGFRVTHTLTARNIGTAPLSVTNITVDRPEFSASPNALTIEPGDTTDIDVTFVPSNKGDISAILTITSNDTSATDREVILTAKVLDPPIASLSVDTLRVRLKQTRSCDETITLENTGASELEWIADLSFERDLTGGAATSGFRITPETGEASESSLMDVVWYGTHGPLGSALWTVAFADIAAAGGTVTESDNPIDETLLQPYDILWLGDTDTVFSTQEIEAIAGWVGSGGCLLIEAKNLTAVDSYQRVFDAMEAPIELRSVPTPNGSTDAIWPHQTTLGISALFFPNPTAVVYNALPPAGFLVEGRTGAKLAAYITVGKGRLIIVTDWIFSDLAIHNADNRRFMKQVFGWLSGTAWLDITPLGGMLPPGDSEDIMLSFDTGDLPPDDYRLQLDVFTNDPLHPILAVPVTMEVEALVPRQMELAMETGLNLRSWNVELDAESTATILSPIIDVVESVQGFDGGGLTFDPSVPPEFNTLKTMDHFHGYWFRLSGSATLTLNGFVFDHRTSLPLAAGYNLVGYLPEAPDSTAHAIESVFDHLEVVLGYDGEGLTFDPSIPPQFNTLQMMRPGYGYWVKLAEPDTLSYPELPIAPVSTLAAASTAGGQTPPPESADDRSAAAPQTTDRTSVVVPTREWIGVWGQNVRIDGEPIATLTVITALDKDGTVCGRCTAHHPGEFGIMAIYRDDPDTETDEGATGPNETITVVVGDHAFDGVEWTGMGAVIDFNDVARLSDSPDRVPLRSALYQNFPNPFNPTTTIAFDLASSADVRLAVYNVRGQRVRELVNEKKPPGRYRAEWDGNDGSGRRVASGVYFYRLEAGSYTRTLKMVLLK